MDVSKLPSKGPKFDLIVDSYCTQGIVKDEDREGMFHGVQGRLTDRSYFLLTCSVFESKRVNPDVRIEDPSTGKVYIRFEDEDLFDPESEICYTRFKYNPNRPGETPESYDGTVCVDDQ